LYPTLLLNSGALNYYTNSTTVITGGTPPAYAWSHVALVRNSTSTILYLNGVQTGSTYSDSNNYLDGTNAPVIGASGFSRGSSYFNGHMSNLRFVNGTAVYTSSFTPPTAPPTPTANTSLLLLGTNSGIQDQTGKNNLITVSSNTETGIVKYGSGAMYFNGPGTYVTEAGGSGNWQTVFGVGSGPWTLECWVYITNLSLTGGQMVYGDCDSSTNNGTYTFNINTSGNVVLFQYTSASSGTAYTTTGTVSANTWTHVAWSKTGTTLYMSINGTVQSFTVSASAYYASPINQPYIGSQGAYTTRGFSGYIDDFRITKGIARYTTNFTAPSSALIAV